jgi:hypothetical protein
MSERNGLLVRAIHRVFPAGHFAISVLFIVCALGLIGFAVGGAFLSLAYFDLPYYIVVILVVLRGVVRQELVAAPKGAA